MSSESLWIEHPYQPGTYIKKFGQVWKSIHEQQCFPRKYNIKKEEPLKKFYETSFGAGTKIYLSTAQYA